ncbi:zinc finger MYM-type protein 4-like [Arapaima gigas]
MILHLLRTAVQCNQCKVTAVPQYHLAMSDSSMRSFCCYSCVIGFQTDFNKLATQAQMSVVPQMAPAPAAPATPAVPTVTVTQPPPAPSTVAPDAATPKAPPLIVSLSPSTRTVVRLTCRHCSRLFASKPELFQFKGEMIQFCGKTCAEEFKKVNLVMARCEYCKIDKILKEVKKINHQDCSFCSEGCKLLYKHDLAKRWGRHCQSCAYCSNTSQRVVQNHFAGKLEEFCGDACMSQYTVLFYQMSRCDTCRRQGKLIESLQWLGEMKHFCNLQCLLQFCSQQSPADAQLTMAPLPVALAVPSSTVPTMPSPSSLASKEATPVIANVVSLASTPMGQPSMCANATLQGTIPMAPAKVTGHASTQTDTLKLPPAAPRILKNKALLCKPMNLNKGTICKPHTQSAHTQTEEEPSRVFVLTVPVPVFVPVPLHLYTQLTPVPVGIPVPVRHTSVPLRPPSAPLSCSHTHQPDRGGKEGAGPGGEVIQRGARWHPVSESCSVHHPADQGSSFSGDQESASVSSPRRCGDEANGSNGREGGTPTDATSLTQLLDLEAEYPADLLVKGQKVTPKPRIRRRPRDGFPPRKRGRKRAAAVSTTPSEELPPSGGSKLLHMYGVGAWKRWVQQRDKQPNTETPGFNRQPVGLKQDLLQCSPAELSCGLSLFVSEVRRPSGVPYNPDSIFYLCLGIQQYLLENGRVENIFTDELYSGFVEQLTKMLRDWKPPILPNGYLHSRVEEEHLWVCKQLGDHSPAVLLNTLLFFTTKLFHLKTPSQHGCLSFAHVLHRTRTLANNRNGKFLHFCLPVEKRQDRAVGEILLTLGKRKMEEEEVMEIPENLEDPLRCPVRLYEFYLSKCPDSVKQRTDVFYLQPECPWVPDCPLWFSSRPLESSTLEAMLTRILSVRELQQDGVQAPPLASLSDKEASE